MSLRRRLLVPVAIAGTLAGSTAVLLPPLTVRAATFTVTTTTDEHLTTAGNTSCASASGCSLRAAIEAANNAGGATTVNVPSGTYNLTLGVLSVGNYPGAQSSYNVTISGAGSATTIIHQASAPSDRVFLLDAPATLPSPRGSVTVSISGVTVSGGTDTADGLGGGGIAGGSGSVTPADSLSLNDVVVTNNATTNSTASNSYGGGLQWVGGSLTISNSTFSNNNSRSSSGGGAYVEEQNNASTVTISGSTFASNTLDNQTNPATLEGGAGLAVNNLAGSSLSLSGDTFQGNTATSTNSVAAVTGGALYLQGKGTVSDSTFTGNAANGPVDANLEGGGAISATGGAASINYSRIAGNSATNGPSGLEVNTADANTLVDETHNWWGCNAPNGTGCTGMIFPSTSGGKSVFDPWNVLQASASPNKIRINQSTTITGSMVDSNGTALADKTVLAGLPITFDTPVLGTIPQAQPETLTPSLTATATYNSGGVGGNGSAHVTVDQAIVTVPIVVLQPPSITTSFGATTMPINGTTTVSFSVTNGNTVSINGSFTDSLPAGMQVASTPAVTNTCGGTVTAAANATSISWSNSALAVGTCAISVNVTATGDDIYTNSVTIDSTDAGNGNTSAANLTVINPPHVVKQFGASSIPLNGSTSLTFTVDSNSNQKLTLNGVAFTDSLPAGVVVSTPSGLSNTCGGTATANDGDTSVNLTGVSVAPSSSCTVTLNVTATTAGAKVNTVQVTSTNGGTGNTSSASVTAVAPPTLAKNFGASSIPLNGTTTLTFTVGNPNSGTTLTGVGFNDPLPGGLVVASSPGLVSTCSNATVTAAAGSSVLSVSGATLPQSTTCTITVNVTGVSAGPQLNTTGNISSTEGGTGSTATASVDVIAPPSIAKAFSPTPIAVNATTSLQFTITNSAANDVSLTGVAFSDTLPTGLTVANSTTTVCGGTLTTTAPTGITLSGATIAANSRCLFAVTVTGAVSGQYTNTTGNVTSTNGGTGNTASAGLVVASPPSITKAFGASSIPVNGTTSLTFTIANGNTGVGLTGVGFTDSLPAGLVVSTPNLSNTCGGTATATAGSGSVTLSAGTIAASQSCTLSVDVTGTTAGTKSNSVQVTSTEGGTGNTSNASITVVAPPTISKQFGAASIPLNGSTSLSFTVNNPNSTTTLTGVGVADTLPAGLVVATPSGVTSTCPGSVAATDGGTTVSLSGSTLTPSSGCTFGVNVTGTAAGTQNNTTDSITSNEGGTGGTASASIDVEAPPTIAKVFTPDAVSLNASTSLAFTIANPAANADPLSGVAFTDTLPSGLTVANASTTVCGGTLTTTAPASISLSGAGIAVNGQCQFAVTVTGAASGDYTNTTGNVTSTNGGTGNTASANLEVASPPSIAKAFGSALVAEGDTTSLTFTLTNPNTAVTLTGVAFTDALPAGLTVAPAPNLSNTCGGTATATAGDTAVSLSSGVIPVSSNCTVSVDVRGDTAGAKNNNVQATSNEAGSGNTGIATTTVVAPPSLSKQFGAASIPLNGTTSLSFTVDNPNSGTTLTGVGFSDSLPSGLEVATPNGLTGSCGGGTITATAGSGSVTLSGASLAATTGCTFSVNVTGITAGTQDNTTGTVTSTEGGTGNTASASIDVEAPPSIAKAFSPSAISMGSTTSLQFTVANPAANADPLTGVAFSDTLPSGLTVASSTATVCGGTLTTTAATRTIALSGATIAVDDQCQFAVTVTGAVSGQYTNTTGNVSSSNGGTGNTGSAPLTVAVPPVIGLAFGAPNIPLNGTTTFTVTLTNPPSDNVPLTGVAFSAPLPAGLVISTPSGAVSTCGGTPTAAAGGSLVALSGVSLPVHGSCTLTVSVHGITTGVKSTSATATSNEAGMGNTASATVVVTIGGYWLVASDGGVFTYGNALFHGSATGLHLNAPVVGLAATTDGGGYWLVAADGGVFTYGDAVFHGSAAGLHLNAPVVGIAPTPSGGGYWLVAADGGVFAYGDALYHGAASTLHVNAPIVGIAPTPSGGGYWLVGADGGVFAYGDAAFHGAASTVHLNKPIVGIAASSDGGGYWLTGSDGGVFTYGDAVFHGSAATLSLNAPAVGMARTPTGNGYWVVASDGGVFAYGDAIPDGAAASIRLNRPIEGIASTGF